MALVANKKEPQELADAEESKSSVDQWTGISSPTMADRQPQSLVLQEPPHLSEQSELLRSNAEVRALQLQLAHMRIECEGLRRQLDNEGRGA